MEARGIFGHAPSSSSSPSHPLSNVGSCLQAPPSHTAGHARARSLWPRPLPLRVVLVEVGEEQLAGAGLAALAG